MRVFGIVRYKGTNYQGWQKQADALTIQEIIEDTLSTIFNEQINIYGSGRTDAGVHAYGQTFHFDVNKENVDLDKTTYSLNMMLPNDIEILKLSKVDSSFQARYDAKEKIYCYKISFTNKNPFEYETHFIENKKFDKDIFKEALTHFIGKKCFKNFTSKEEDKDNFVREIFSIEIEENAHTMNITFTGNGFMRYMIRFIVGTCLAVGEGKQNIAYIDDKLNSTSRMIVSYKAEPQGLYLVSVKY